jgi:hypothetical protein
MKLVKPFIIKTVNEKVYKHFIDTGEVDPSIIKLIAVKIVKQEPLNKYEHAIFFDKTAEINEELTNLI